jgi:hypothetical protein
MHKKALNPWGNTSDRLGSRLCENAQEPTRRRIVFSIALFPIAATALFLFRLTKSRKLSTRRLNAYVLPWSNVIVRSG